MNTLTLNQVLYKLLFKASYREHFLNGHYEQLCTTEENLSHLETIDKEELRKTCQKLALTLLKGNQEEESGLAKAYARSLEIINNLGISSFDLVYKFMESADFDLHKEVPFNGTGICMEEAFYLFMSRQSDIARQSPELQHILLHEYCTVMTASLAINQDPNFSISCKEIIKYNGTAYYAIIEHPASIAPYFGKEHITGNFYGLYSVNKNSDLIYGIINGLLSELIELGTAKRIEANRPVINTKYNLTNTEMDSVTAALVQKGLVA